MPLMANQLDIKVHFYSSLLLLLLAAGYFLRPSSSRTLDGGMDVRLHGVEGVNVTMEKANSTERDVNLSSTTTTSTSTSISSTSFTTTTTASSFATKAVTLNLTSEAVNVTMETGDASVHQRLKMTSTSPSSFPPFPHTPHPLLPLLKATPDTSPAFVGSSSFSVTSSEGVAFGRNDSSSLNESQSSRSDAPLTSRERIPPNTSTSIAVHDADGGDDDDHDLRANNSTGGYLFGNTTKSESETFSGSFPATVITVETLNTDVGDAATTSPGNETETSLLQGPTPYAASFNLVVGNEIETTKSPNSSEFRLLEGNMTTFQADAESTEFPGNESVGNDDSYAMRDGLPPASRSADSTGFVSGNSTPAVSFAFASPTRGTVTTAITGDHIRTEIDGGSGWKNGELSATTTTTQTTAATTTTATTTLSQSHQPENETSFPSPDSVAAGEEQEKVRVESKVVTHGLTVFDDDDANGSISVDRRSNQSTGRGFDRSIIAHQRLTTTTTPASDARNYIEIYTENYIELQKITSKTVADYGVTVPTKKRAKSIAIGRRRKEWNFFVPPEETTSPSSSSPPLLSSSSSSSLSSSWSSFPTRRHHHHHRSHPRTRSKARVTREDSSSLMEESNVSGSRHSGRHAGGQRRVERRGREQDSRRDEAWRKQRRQKTRKESARRSGDNSGGDSSGAANGHLRHLGPLTTPLVLPQLRNGHPKRHRDAPYVHKRSPSGLDESNEIAAQSAAGKSFVFSDCGKDPGRSIKFLKFRLEPAPIQLTSWGGKVKLSAKVNITRSLPSVMSADVTVVKFVMGVPMTVPCFNHVGSCHYKNLCKQLDDLWTSIQTRYQIKDHQHHHDPPLQPLQPPKPPPPYSSSSSPLSSSSSSPSPSSSFPPEKNQHHHHHHYSETTNSSTGSSSPYPPGAPQPGGSWMKPSPLLISPDHGSCPRLLRTQYVPCKCPFLPSLYTLKKFVVPMPSLGLSSVFVEGEYEIKLELNDGTEGTQLGCLKASFEMRRREKKIYIF